jgi:hypothetical protein
MFSQDDMSFLSLNKNVKNQKEDYLRLSKNNPEVFGELKEKIYYYMQNNNQIKNVISKGYIGLMIVPKFHINKKTFSLIEIQPQWKDNNIYQNKEFNPNLIKTTETTYKIDIFNSTNAIKFLTYSINSEVLFNTKYINPNFIFDREKSIININILYNNININSKIYKIVVTLFECKGNIIGTDGILNKINNNTFSVTYNNGVKIIKIVYSNNNFDFKKINVRFELKGIYSDNNIRISYNANNKNNNNVESEDLNIEKLALISFDYLM